jgi:hypothetical protein
MIVSASYRTDIPAFYGPWFRNRLQAGFARVRNPYGGPPSIVPLTADAVDGFVFWTRNAGPFLPVLAEVRARGIPFIVQYTITGYPRALDRATIAAEDAARQVERIVAEHGPGTVVWRYDPIVATTLTDGAFHRCTFARLADRLAGLVDEVVASWAQTYRKTARNLDRAAQSQGFAWRDPSAEEKCALLRELAATAGARGMALSLCGQPELRKDGIAEARCIDVERLARLGGRPIAASLKAHRPTCGCYASRDLGDYDTCPHGCVYCYAVTSRTAARRRRTRHQPEGEFLIPGTA